MRKQLVSWQWSSYPDGHHDHANLIIHVLTVPLFMAGTVALAAAWLWPWLLLIGPAVMVTALALQGRGHKREAVAPVPFDGPVDVLSRLFVEQWVTFPRYLISGSLARSWRQSSR